MASVVSSLLTAFGLSSASGLNAYIPLLMVALAARFTDWIKLDPPFDILKNEFVIGALVILLIVETIVDKVPAADSLNDFIQTFIRPTAGAILFAASTSVIQLNPVIAFILGLILAFGVHATKSTARPVVTATTGGLGNAFVSVGEDILSAGMTLIALIVPMLIGVFFVLIGLWFLWRQATRPRPA